MQKQTFFSKFLNNDKLVYVHVINILHWYINSEQIVFYVLCTKDVCMKRGNWRLDPLPLRNCSFHIIVLNLKIFFGTVIQM